MGHCLFFFVFLVSYFYFLKWDMRPKQRVMNPKISISGYLTGGIKTVHWTYFIPHIKVMLEH
jgi:hypothetical protein